MTRNRRIGQALVVTGFVVATAVGLFLAVQASAGKIGARQATMISGVVFVALVPIVGYGIFLYTKQDDPPPAISPILKQRELMDVLRSREQMEISELAQQLDITERTAQEMIQDLITLDIFSGFVNWDDGVVSCMDAEQLLQLSHCSICDIPIQVKHGIVCQVCKTGYYAPPKV